MKWMICFPSSLILGLAIRLITRTGLNNQCRENPTTYLQSVLSSQGERVADFRLEGLFYILKLRQQLKYIFSSITVKSKEMGS